MNRGFHARWGLRGIGRLGASLGMGPDFNSIAYTASLSESLTLAESLSVGMAAKVLTLAESTTLAEALSVSLAASAGVSESLSLAEALGVQLGANVTPVESVTLSEALSVAMAATVAPSESLALSEAVSVSRGMAVSLSEPLSLSEALSVALHARPMLVESLTITEATNLSEHLQEFLTETLTLSEALAVTLGAQASVVEGLVLGEHLDVIAASVDPVSPTHLNLTFTLPVRLANVDEPGSYRVTPLAGGVPVAVLSASPRRLTLGSGVDATVAPSPGLYSQVVNIGVSASAGDRLRIVGAWQDVEATVIADLGGGLIQVDRPLLLADPLNGTLAWTLYGGVFGASLTVTETTGGEDYVCLVQGLHLLGTNRPYQARIFFTALGDNPYVVSTTTLPDDGTILVTFSEDLVPNSQLLDPSLYEVTGAVPVVVQSVRQVAPRQVAVQVLGMSVGTYSIALPLLRDLAKNPLDSPP